MPTIEASVPVLSFETGSVDHSLIQHYELAFSDKFPGHRAKAKPAFDKGGFVGYKVFIDGESSDFGGLVIEPRKMILALRDLLRRGI